MAGSRYVPIFNKQLEKFLDQLEDRFPSESDIGLLKSAVSITKRTHPEEIVSSYWKYVYAYKSAIDKEDEDFFLDAQFVPKIEEADTDEVHFKVQYFKKLFKSKDMDLKTKENIWLHLKLLNKLIDKINSVGEVALLRR